MSCNSMCDMSQDEKLYDTSSSTVRESSNLSSLPQSPSAPPPLALRIHEVRDDLHAHDRVRAVRGVELAESNLLHTTPPVLSPATPQLLHCIYNLPR